MANYVIDSFLDTDGTLLSAHTPDVGGAWTGYTATPVITANQCGTTAFTASAAVNASTPATADYQVSADVTLQTPSSGNGAGVRIRDSGELLAYQVLFDFDAGEWQLTHGFTSIGTYADPGFTDGVTRTVVLSAVGTTINVNINGVDRITVTDATLAVGNGGLIAKGGSATGAVLDNFRVDDITSGPPAGTHVVTGRDSFTLDPATTFLSTSIDGRPAWITSGAAEPPNWFHVGMLSWGTALHGAFHSYPVTRDLDLVEIPAGCDMLWFEFAAGITATLIELTAP